MKRPQFSLRMMLLVTALIATLIGWRLAEQQKQHVFLNRTDPELEIAWLQKRINKEKDRSFETEPHSFAFTKAQLDQMKSEFEQTKQIEIDYDTKRIRELETTIFTIDHPNIWSEVIFDSAAVAVLIGLILGIVIWIKCLKAAGQPTFVKRDGVWLAILLFFLAIEAAAFLWQQSNLKAERDDLRDLSQEYVHKYIGEVDR